MHEIPESVIPEVIRVAGREYSVKELLSKCTDPVGVPYKGRCYKNPERSAAKLERQVFFCTHTPKECIAKYPDMEPHKVKYLRYHAHIKLKSDTKLQLAVQEYLDSQKNK